MEVKNLAHFYIRTTFVKTVRLKLKKKVKKKIKDCASITFLGKYLKFTFQYAITVFVWLTKKLNIASSMGVFH